MDEPRCGLPDPCLCTGREGCLSADDEACLQCLSKTCAGDCDEAYAEDDSFGDRPMVTEDAFAEAGLL
jgi:hypothetical protein